jgi:DNA-binding LacI/PurR family transcriptional regulator
MDRLATAIVDLARRMESDISDRALVPGDAYLSAAEAAAAFRTSTTRANRALQLLEKRRVLIRRQRTGAIIAPPDASPRTVAIRRVNFVVAQNYMTTEGLGADGVIAGIQSALPGTDFQFRFIPEANDNSSVDSMVDEALRSSETEGFVLVRASRAIQKTVAASRLPMVVYGTPYPSQETVYCVDRGQASMGAMLTRYLLGQGAKRILAIMRPLSLHGDNLLLDGVRAELQSAGCGIDAFEMRALPPDEDVLQATIRQTIQSGQGPIGVLCRSEPLASATQLALDEVLSKPQQGNRYLAGICAADIYGNRQVAGRFPTAKPTISPEQIGEQIGQMLQQQAEGVGPSPSTFIIPTELYVPE